MTGKGACGWHEAPAMTVKGSGRHVALAMTGKGRVDANRCNVACQLSRASASPEGWARSGRKAHAARAREAQEEAGVAAKITKRPVGPFR